VTPAGGWTPTSAWADAEPAVHWLDTPKRPAPREPLSEPTNTDLAVVGAGFTGLWTAILAKQREPDRDVVVLDGERVGWAASGRNGGFCSASLTHGYENGASRFPGEIDVLEHLGAANLDAIERTVTEFGIDCDFRRAPALSVATRPHQAEWLRNDAGQFLDAEEVRSLVNSPTYLAGSLSSGGLALVDPARLAWGLARAAESLGVRIHEHTPVRRLRRSGGRMLLTTRTAPLTARTVALGTSAFPSLLRRTRLHTVPVHDYVLVTEPLTESQRASINWRNGAGMDDLGNQFHYYRMTADHRILWGGYDAIYHYGRRMGARYDQRPATFATLSEHFFETFPQLEGVRFTHRWGGAIDTSTRFCAFFGTAHGGAVAYAAGYTGLGVGASRFGADVVLDLLSGVPSDRTRLDMVRRRPVPFPPEPLAYLGIQITRRSLQKADRDEGRRDLWLRTLDRLGLGFDS
jgi:glycine/D-amino acid oxidase-like deaminating enzyme